MVSDLDLSAAVEPAARAYFDAAGVHFDTIGLTDQVAARHCMTAAVTAAAPLIERQVRERVAREVWEWGQRYTCFTNAGHAAQVVARITRGGAS